MIAGQHDHADASGTGLRHGIGDALAQRVGERHQAEPAELEALHDGWQCSDIVVPDGGSDRQYAQAVASHRIDVGEHRRALFGGHVAQVGHGFRRALAGHHDVSATLPDVGDCGAGGRQRIFAQQDLRRRAVRSTRCV